MVAETGRVLRTLRQADAEFAQLDAADPGERSSSKESIDREPLARWAAATVVVLAVVAIVRMQPGAWAGLAALFFGVVLTVRAEIAPRVALTSALAIATTVSAVDYFSWRATVINWPSWWIALPLLAAEVFGALHALGFQYTVWPRRQPPLHRRDDPSRRPIYLFIPTVNEGVGVLEPTVRGALAARDRYLNRYPHAHIDVVICNDGRVAGAPNWREIEALAHRYGVTCITRSVKGGAKAGNIEHARQQVGATGEALLAIFDADQIAAPEFLLQAVDPFADPAVGWVQTGQYYRNLDNSVARWANDEQDIFYRLMCSGKAAVNAAFICGTNVVLRAAALDEIGGLPQDSVTEDFAASILLHHRWRSVYLTDVLATGLGPMDLRSYQSQQARWSAGTFGVLRRHWRAIFLPGRGGLQPAQRVQYALACTHYLCGLRNLVYLLAPVVYLCTGISVVHGATLQSFLWHFLPYFLAAQLAFVAAASGRLHLRGIVLGFGAFPVYVTSIFTVLFNRRIGFTVTAKYRSNGVAWRRLLPQGIAVVAGAAALAYGNTAGHRGVTGLVSTVWLVSMLLMLGGTFWLGGGDALAAWLTPLSWLPRLRPAHPRHLHPGRLSSVAGGVVVLVLLVLSVGHDDVLSHQTPKSPALDAGHPLLGVSLPANLLAQPTVLQRQLHVPFSVVGRTQTLGDRFDEPWADHLDAQGASPWITLLFGVPDQQSLADSLPAIANGLHDDDLRRWADEIRDYSRPVYLTILPQVDRNYALTSAVAGGNIPQDVPRAWEHVQAIFKAENATNVAWVWAPADPIHDGPYAPPATTIDVALISMISYPHTAWANPAGMLSQLSAHYPHKPLFVEVSADGPAAQKAAWLRSVGAAVGQTPDVRALLYHEGSPALHPTIAENAAWSMDSGPLTLEAMYEAAQAAGAAPLISWAQPPVAPGTAASIPVARG